MTPPARPTPKANVAALVTEIMEEARKNAEEPAPSRSRLVPSYVAAGLVIALCAWAGSRPGMARSRPVAAPSREYREASARVALALHAQRIEAYRHRTDASRDETGSRHRQRPDRLRRTDSLSFELSSPVDGQPVTYKSSQPRDRYLAEAMTALSRARR